MGGGGADVDPEADANGVASPQQRTKKTVIPGLQDELSQAVSLDGDCNGGAALTNPCNGPSSASLGALNGSHIPWSHDDYVRILMQALEDLGYSGTAAKLEAESGLKLQNEPTAKLQAAVLDGNWILADSLLDGMPISNDTRSKWRVEIRRQRFLELLDAQQMDKALEYLRSEIATLSPDKQALQDLTCLLLSSSPQELRERASWPGPTPNMRRQLWGTLKETLPPNMVIPSRRLEKLLLQSLTHQEEHCVHYNVPDPWRNLLEDCHASTDQNLPQTTIHLLEDHRDEVWYIQFSHNGKHLASASKDKTVIIWDVSLASASARLVLRGHANSVAFVAWSPDDSMLLSCGNDHIVRVWDTVTGECRQVRAS